MPNRIIKEGVKHSEQIDTLSWFEEVLFYRLIVSADDYGCFDGRPILLKNELFPLKENITKKAVEDAVDKLASVGLLCKYTVNGKPYLFFPSWEKHQRIRNKHRKYPEPPKDTPSEGCLSNDGQATATCLSESESNPNPIRIQSESESNPNSRDAAFDVFWKAYPKKVGKQDAKKVFRKVNVPLETLLSAIERQKCGSQWSRDNGQYIPNPATWLRQGRWEDEEYVPDTAKKQYTRSDFFDT